MTAVRVGVRCPGCGVVCASLDVEHLDSCRYQGRDALTLLCPPDPLQRRADEIYAADRAQEWNEGIA